MLAFLLGGMLVLWGLAQVSGGMAGGSGITSGLSNFRDGSTVDKTKVDLAIRECANRTYAREVLGDAVDDYGDIDLGRRDETDVQLADDEDGGIVLVLSGNLEGSARDFGYDKVGTWKCVARYRDADSSIPHQIDVEVVGL